MGKNDTSSGLAALALARHRSHWNWTLHLAGLVVLALSLLLHGPLTASAGLILLGAGFFSWPEPPHTDGRWQRFVRAGIEWEKDWIAAPWNRRKWIPFLAALLIGGYILWALWVRELASLALLIGFAVLLRVRKENKENGIDP
ncbi:hypothetical protein [Pseudodesulfovibrio sp.]|uniref:hypothetical protein n=1 Tax=unclassified Pseudodesulfovibrio TaxID=2661612 RepID=UPI003B00D072